MRNSQRVAVALQQIGTGWCCTLQSHVRFLPGGHLLSQLPEDEQALHEGNHCFFPCSCWRLRHFDNGIGVKVQRHADAGQQQHAANPFDPCNNRCARVRRCWLVRYSDDLRGRRDRLAQLFRPGTHQLRGLMARSTALTTYAIITEARSR